jgi:hypothetical protein
VLDFEQNWFLVSMSNVNGVFKAHFWRYLLTCDTNDVSIAGTVRCLY